MQPHSEGPGDAITFVDDERGEDFVIEDSGLARWKILVVDDDEEVHAVTRYVLGRAEVLGRPLELVEARTIKHAQDQLLVHTDIAVILLDVVMEDHDSGLRFARWVREAGLRDVRIILRTGQPGYAPELDVIRDYDINDYRAKNELTHTRLITSITAAVRAYEQIHATERTWRGLERILASCSQLFRRRDLASFSEGVLLQMTSLCGFDTEGMICVFAEGMPRSNARIVTATAGVSPWIGRSVGDLPDGSPLKAGFLNAPEWEADADEGLLILPMESSGLRHVAVLSPAGRLDAMDAALLRLFAANVAAGFEAIGLIEHLARRPEAAEAARA